MVYRLTIEPVEPDFSLALAADSFVLEKGKPLEVTVNVAVRDGLREPIEIHAVGLPPGVTAEPVKFEPSGDSPVPLPAAAAAASAANAPQPSGPSVKLDPQGRRGCHCRRNADPHRRPHGRLFVSRPHRPLSAELAAGGQHYAAWLTVNNSRKRGQIRTL